MHRAGRWDKRFFRLDGNKCVMHDCIVRVHAHEYTYLTAVSNIGKETRPKDGPSTVPIACALCYTDRTSDIVTSTPCVILWLVFAGILEHVSVLPTSHKWTPKATIWWSVSTMGGRGNFE